MSRPPTTTRARAAFAQLVVVLAGLVGIALVQGALCQAAMSMGGMDMAMEQPVAAVGVVVQDIGSIPVASDPILHVESAMQHADIGVREVVAAVDVMDGRSAPAPAGIVMACLAVFLALLTVLAIPRRGGASYVIRSRRPGRAVRPRSALPRAPSLAELCVLRT
ncbi:hypothetical protein [Nocardia sp. NBC_01388]|uniref:hypothetical protein n=1 Tax=Nocardia sp. NBC_01388 TaxID=2903596 RepID=UPI003247F5C8